MTVDDRPHVIDADVVGSAFEAAVTGMAVLDMDGRFVSVNPALCRMLGRTAAELIGTTSGEITHPDDRPISTDLLARMAAGDADGHQTRKRYLRPDGSVVHVVRTTTVLRDRSGRRLGLFTQVLDVGEAAEAQLALQRSERRLHALLARSSELSVVLDGEGRIVYASPASTRILGHEPSVLEGRSCFDFLHPDELEAAAASLREHLDNQGGDETLDYRIRHRDGSWRRAAITVTNLFADPAIGGLVVNVRDVTEERSYQERVAASEERLRSLVSNSWDVITLHDADGRYLYASPAVTGWLGWEPKELMQLDSFTTLIHPDDIGKTVGEFFAAVTGTQSGAGLAVQYRARRKGGGYIWVESTAHSRLDDPAVGGIVVTTREIGARRRRAAQQDAVAALSGLAIRGCPLDELFARTVTAVAEVLEVDNVAVLRCVGDGHLEVERRHGHALIDGAFPLLANGRPATLASQALLDGASVVWSDADPGQSDGTGLRLGRLGRRSGVATVVTVDGEPYGALACYSAEPDAFSTDDLSFVESVANVLAAAIGRNRAEAELRRQALCDELTGLPNRTAMLEHLASVLRRLERQRGSVALLFIDTDDFKLVNDSLGHATGDRVVQEVASRLRDVVRRWDTVARFGGDEFAVVCEDTDAAAAAEIAERVRAALATPVDVDGRQLSVTGSIGLAVTTGRLSPDDLLAQADTAMYAAKQRGKNCAVMFDLAMRRQVTERLEVASGLRRALADEELRLWYQPVTGVADGQVVGFEALVRWEHPYDGLLGPDRFIPVAEETGLIIEMGEWVLRRAAAQAAEWRRRGFPGRVAVNVSARQLTDSDLVSTLRRVLDDTGCGADCLSLEVTESAVMSDLARAAAVLGEVRALGLEVGMDDFGTGHSSLSYLANLPFDFVKIDRSFVARFHTERRAAALLETIATLCRSLDLVAVAEGVETEAELAEIRRLGIARAQGYLLGRPVPPDRLAPGR